MKSETVGKIGAAIFFLVLLYLLGLLLYIITKAAMSL